MELADSRRGPVTLRSEASFATYRGLVYDTVTIDGRYAAQAADVRLVVGAATYAHAAAEYRGNNADDSALDSLLRVSGGVRVSAHVPAVAIHGPERDCRQRRRPPKHDGPHVGGRRYHL